MRVRLLVLTALVLAGVGTVAAAGPASAECIEVTLEIHREGQPHWYPLGGPEHCVTGTPWGQGQDITAFYEEEEPLVPGVLSGFWLQVWTVGP